MENNINNNPRVAPTEKQKAIEDARIEEIEINAEQPASNEKKSVVLMTGTQMERPLRYLAD